MGTAGAASNAYVIQGAKRSKVLLMPSRRTFTHGMFNIPQCLSIFSMYYILKPSPSHDPLPSNPPQIPPRPHLLQQIRKPPIPRPRPLLKPPHILPQPFLIPARLSQRKRRSQHASPPVRDENVTSLLSPASSSAPSTYRRQREPGLPPRDDGAEHEHGPELPIACGPAEDAVPRVRDASAERVELRG